MLFLRLTPARAGRIVKIFTAKLFLRVDPPRIQGEFLSFHLTDILIRLIPAHAGRILCVVSCVLLQKVDPRACGVNTALLQGSEKRQG